MQIEVYSLLEKSTSIELSFFSIRMTSFIPILALFVLVLSNGCFSVPVDGEPNSSSTFTLI